MNKEDIKQIIGVAMLFDEKHRFDSWHGDEVKEWVGMVAEAIWSAQQSVQRTSACCRAEIVPGIREGESDLCSFCGGTCR